MGGADRGPLRPFLHVTLSCSPGISLYRLHIFSSLSLTQTHEHMCLLYNIHIHFILMVTQGTSSSRHLALFNHHLLLLQRWCPHLYHLFPLSRPVVPFLCPVHLNHFRALDYRQSCSCKFAISNPSLLQNPCCLCPLLLLSDAPSAIRCTIFPGREVFSIQAHCISHIFYCNRKRLACWDHFLLFSVAMKILRLLLVCVAAGCGEGKKNQTKQWSHLL